MADVFALVEHRQGSIRDITYELLTCGRKAAADVGGKLTAVVLGYQTEKFIESLKTRADRILVVDNEVFKEFNAETYQITLAEILKRYNPLITLIGHTASGMDICPSLAVQMNLPFTTDCLGLEVKGQELWVTRQMYDGKLNARVRLQESGSYILTIRSGCFPAEDSGLSAEIERFEPPITAQPEYRKFIEYVEAAVGEVDITKADIVVSVGRGIKEQSNLPVIEDFASAIGGVLACSRPIVDAGWLPKDRQVGSSGKTVKPKVYIALGISGAFQHLVGMKGSDTIIAVNKDPNAPIFNEADYGIVDDLFKVVPVLKNKIMELKEMKG
ncbi:MAG TPA: electron transfer flavoprotein subunit alpha/FixB family protein [candidate division WOR-3 bacterium]|uniref:Electron transfer flavoprotein subunit alpha/FixB family protein n=1 Tax=candidate division WOR-3 bacterium TaxID=2052148 RepID=A0A9C9EMK1_UNCW3|nr:electron transfer flavoprotein subunit alpha/FixB family protein [candidate division WOR-3 bacterium]